jgi:hypothetical protein
MKQTDKPGFLCNSLFDKTGIKAAISCTLDNSQIDNPTVFQCMNGSGHSIMLHTADHNMITRFQQALEPYVNSHSNILCENDPRAVLDVE